MFRRPSEPKRRVSGLSPALAPASGSVLQRVPQQSGGPKPSVLSHTPPSTGGSAVGYSSRSLKRSQISRPKTFEMLPSGPAAQSGPWSASRQTSIIVTLAPGLSPSHEFLRMCDTYPVTSSRFEISRSFRWLDHQVRRISLRSDRMKLPVGMRFGKLTSPPFSTFHGFRCGRTWISHRFVAYAITRNNISLLPIATCQKSQAQGIELNEPLCVLLIICACIVLECHMRL